MPRITINGQVVEVDAGLTILEAAAQAGIRIPTLCHHPDLTPFGGCRLCVVEIKGEPRPVASCGREAQEGMQVRTETPALRKERRQLLKLFLSQYYQREPAREGDENELLFWARHYRLPVSRWMARAPRYPLDSDPNPFIRVDLNRRILCERCVR
ncbi:MAG TPA: 2Fe-2S iron-sulfur cluster-binding protein, partial [Anaerolinea sp.]|nr:2Fe-2S iron-sulfur cluster-binding protein [Anaerolinea sp.]